MEKHRRQRLADLSSFQASMRQMVLEVQRASSQVQQQVKGIDSGMTQLATTAKSVGAAMGVAFSATAVVSFGKAMIGTSMQMTSLTLSLKQATGGLDAAKSALGFVRAGADRSGTSVTASTLGFTKLANATKGRRLPAKPRARSSALSESTQALGLSTDQYGRALDRRQPDRPQGPGAARRTPPVSRSRDSGASGAGHRAGGDDGRTE